MVWADLWHSHCIVDHAACSVGGTACCRHIAVLVVQASGAKRERESEAAPAAVAAVDAAEPPASSKKRSRLVPPSPACSCTASMHCAQPVSICKAGMGCQWPCGRYGALNHYFFNFDRSLPAGLAQRR